MTKNGISYRDAGVDIDAGNALVDRIKPAAAATRRIPRDRISIQLKEGITAPRSFADYEVSVDEAALPNGVKLLRRIG